MRKIGRDKCSFDGCNKLMSGKGLCNVHYQRYIRGIPLKGNPKMTLLQRIMSKVSKTDSGCWNWTGAKTGGNGTEAQAYPVIRLNGQTKRAHRILYEITTGIILGDLFLLHKCDTPACINPDHLFPGTNYDNMQDMIAKGRDFHPVGENNHSKLREEDVVKIRLLWEEGYGKKELAEKFRVHESTIRSIVDRTKWRHIV